MAIFVGRFVVLKRHNKSVAPISHYYRTS